MKKILVVEDQESIRELLSFNLEQENYEVLLAQDGHEALEILEREHVDLMILDLMLPKLSGMEVCKRVRRSETLATLPILMLTAKSTELDMVLGLEVGADDYMTKPFRIRELLARVGALLRRAGRMKKKSGLSHEDVELFPDQFLVLKAGEEVQLTLKEFLLLQILLEHKGQVLTRSQLLDQVWGYEYEGETRTVDVHVRHLRSKVGEDLISTVRGMGYKINV